MARHAIQLTIADPCTEAWAEMAPVPGGRHCDSCRKAVVDFTGMTDAQIHSFVTNLEGGFCGRALKTQLDRPLLSAEGQRPLRMRNAAAIVAFVAGTAVGAQNPAWASPQTETRSVKPSESDSAAYGRISGQVVDLKGKPVAFASVLLTEPGIAEGISAQTFSDSDGRYQISYSTLDVMDTLILSIRYGKYRSELPLADAQGEKLISSRLELDLELEERQFTTLGGMVGTVVRSYTYKNFFDKHFKRFRYRTLKRWFRS